MLGGTPSHFWEGGGVTPPQVWGGYPIPGLDRGGTPPQVGGGYQSQVWVPPPPCPDLGWGTPPIQTLDGVPPIQTWDGIPSLTWDGVPPWPGMGYPPTWDGVPPGPRMGYPPRPEMGHPPPDLRWGTPLPRPEMGYPPHPCKCGQTHRLVSKHYLPSYFVRGR